MPTTKTLGSNQAKVAYLFGAGATHAELANWSRDRKSDAFLEQNSLLLSEVSKRVCRAAKDQDVFPKSIKTFLSPAGLSNLELFIGLLERNHVECSEETVRDLKARVERDIKDRLRNRMSQFYLHKALLEFHEFSKNEELIGLVTLNYDQVLDEAYRKVFKKEPNYCLTSGTAEQDVVPLLKLHGGFGMKYRQKPLPIVTPALNKNYLELPYSFVWGRALEVLIDCDVLRVVGCSLSTNDVGVIDLIFKAQMRREKACLVQIVDFDPKGNRIRENFGFFPKLERATEIETNLISDPTIQDPGVGANPFKIWLRAKIERLAKSLSVQQLANSMYLKKVLA